MMESANRDARRCARTVSLCWKISPCGSRPPSLRCDGSGNQHHSRSILRAAVIAVLTLVPGSGTIAGANAVRQ